MAKRGPKPGKAMRDTMKCIVDGCGRPFSCRGYCGAHYNRLKRGMEIGAPMARRAPKGAGHLGADGYRVIRSTGHPNAMRDGRMAEHVRVMSEVLGRPLAEHESVHHKNGVRWDNRPSNLELWASMGQPSGQRVDDLVSHAISILEEYAPMLLVQVSRKTG